MMEEEERGEIVKWCSRKTKRGQNNLSLAFLPLANLRVVSCLTSCLPHTPQTRKHAMLGEPWNRAESWIIESSTHIFTHHQALNYWQFQTLLESSSQKALPFALKIFAASFQQPPHSVLSPPWSKVWRKVRDTIEERKGVPLQIAAQLHQKKSWDRHIVLYFTHHKQTNNPQIGNPELTKALNPLGFEKGQCFFAFLLCYHYLYNRSLQTTIMSDVGNKLFGV